MTITTTSRALFHLAFPVSDLHKTREFYVGILGCREGRSSDTWIDFDLYGHQIVAHLVNPPGAEPDTAAIADAGANQVDGHDVPVPHFGLVLPWDEWQMLSDRLRESGMDFDIEPHIRFAGQPGEQGTMFFRDPSGNALEFKSFRDMNQLFAR